MNVSTTSGCAWSAGSNASWILISPGASGTGDGSVQYVVSPNTGGARTGTLTIAGHTFTLAQAALVCAYAISPMNQRLGRGGGTATINVSTSNACTWTASSSTSWISVVSGASGTGNGTVTFSYTRNDSRDNRTGSLTVAGRTATVEQNGGGGNDD